MDAGEIFFYKNGVIQNSGTAAFTGIVDEVSPLIEGYGSGGLRSVTNFGQDSSFAGSKAAQGNQDENGFGDFYYEPPAGYLALCTQNLPDPVVADPSEYFNTVTYTGDGTTSNAITGVGFQPDWVWLKSRNTAQNNYSIDVVRGVNNILAQNTTSSESTFNASWQGLYGNLTSFDADGFTVADGTDPTYDSFNGSSDTYVAWNWKADNTSGVSNTDGTITSTVSANPTAGFSIVSYTGTGVDNTVGHGLSQAPELIIFKNRTSTAGYSWPVYSAEIGATKYLTLNGTAAAATYNHFQDTAPTSSVFYLEGTSANSVNHSGNDHIAYCFHSVEGYSKFGSYTGNGSSDGPFVYTGFRPAFVIFKRSDSTGGFLIFDASRNPYNEVDKELFTHSSNGEGTNSDVDFVSNGFKLRTTSGNNNTSGGTYIYMAFAENPFKYSNAR